MTTTTRIRYDRLEKLAAFLDKLPKKRFDFNTMREERDCGTVACAIGWMPEVFPRLVKAVHTDTTLFTALDRVSEVFGFGGAHHYAYALFYPDAQRPWSRTKLTEKATAKQVAKSIRQFCEWRKNQ